MSDQQITDAQQADKNEAGEQEQTFTQADLDRIVRDRVKREREKFADYDDLKQKAGEAKTAEERLAALEKQYAEAQVAAMRSDVASRYGISAEDRDLFLTGADEQHLVAQAERLAARESERRKSTGNHVPNEGKNPRPAEDPDLEVVRGLFGRTP